MLGEVPEGSTVKADAAPYRGTLGGCFVCCANDNTPLLEPVLCDFSKGVYFYSLYKQRAKVEQRNDSAKSSVVIQLSLVGLLTGAWARGYLQEHSSIK